MPSVIVQCFDMLLFIMLSVILEIGIILSFIILIHNAECFYTEWHYVVWHSAQCHCRCPCIVHSVIIGVPVMCGIVLSVIISVPVMRALCRVSLLVSM